MWGWGRHIAVNRSYYMLYQIRSHAEVQQVGFSPFVDGSDRDGWSEYSVMNQGWITEGLQRQGREPTTPDQSIVPVIYPVNPALANNSLFAHLADWPYP